MKLISLNINRGWSDRGELRGTIKFADNENHTMETNLENQDVAPILEHCANAIIAAGKRAAQNLVVDARAIGAIEFDGDTSSAE